MSYSSWVTFSQRFVYGILAAWMLATLIVAFTRIGGFAFLLFPWWFVMVAVVYLILLTIGSFLDRYFGTIAKVYAPFILIIYWVAVYPRYDPWKNPADSYLTITAQVIMPAIIILDTIRPKNTHYARYRQINADFLITHSYLINTIVYVIYFIVYFIALPYEHDPIYVALGFTLNGSRDVIIAFAGWGVVMAFNTIIALFTWYFKGKEITIGKQVFDRLISHEANENIYVTEPTNIILE